MRCVIQRTLQPARVSIDGEVVGEIDHGLVVLVAFAPGDTSAELDWMVHKLPCLRIFSDAEGRMNLALTDTGGGILLVSQFTLYGHCRKGMRPSFMDAAPPEIARMLYLEFANKLRAAWPDLGEGRFAASMQVDLVNDGPVTLILDREAKEQAK